MSLALRLALVQQRQAINRQLANTARTDNIDAAHVKAYVVQMLHNAYNNKPTALQLAHVQHVAKWQHIIKEAIEGSAFVQLPMSEALSPLKHRLLRSKTLRQLRHNLRLIRGPLALYRQVEQLKREALEQLETDKATALYIEGLLKEIEQQQELLNERKRMIDCLCGVSIQKDDSDYGLLLDIEQTKANLKLSDEEVCQVFGLSRSKLNKLRKECKET